MELFCKYNFFQIEEDIYKCTKFHLLPKTYFYYIHWSDAKEFFDAGLGPTIIKNLKENSYVVHMWNKLSKNYIIYADTSQAYGLLAQEFCPNVINNCGKEF